MPTDIYTVIGLYGWASVPDTSTLQVFICEDEAKEYADKLENEGAVATKTQYFAIGGVV